MGQLFFTNKVLCEGSAREHKEEGTEERLGFGDESSPNERRGFYPGTPPAWEWWSREGGAQKRGKNGERKIHLNAEKREESYLEGFKPRGRKKKIPHPLSFFGGGLQGNKGKASRKTHCRRKMGDFCVSRGCVCFEAGGGKKEKGRRQNPAG